MDTSRVPRNIDIGLKKRKEKISLSTSEAEANSIKSKFQCCRITLFTLNTELLSVRHFYLEYEL